MAQMLRCKQKPHTVKMKVNIGSMCFECEVMTAKKAISRRTDYLDALSLHCLEWAPEHEVLGGGCKGHALEPVQNWPHLPRQRRIRLALASW